MMTNNRSSLLNRLFIYYIIIIPFVALAGCCRFYVDSPPEALCPIETLLLNNTDLPENNWEESGSRDYKGAPIRIGMERIGTSFIGDELFDGVIHEIYRLWDETSAYEAYIDVEDEDFSQLNYSDEWKIPETFPGMQLSADNQRIGCNIFKDSGAEECNFLGTYGPYLVRFSIRQHGLRYSDVKEIIEDIDGRMTYCISQK